VARIDGIFQQPHASGSKNRYSSVAALYADHPLTLGGYYIVVKNNSLIRGYANTIYYVAVGCFCNVVLSSLAAYCMSRRKAVWMKYLILILTFTMFFNGGMIPTYMVNKALGINNTRWVIIVMGVISVFNIIIIRTAFLSCLKALRNLLSWTARAI
jgi:putative aldouronate transport system permease protein